MPAKRFGIKTLQKILKFVTEKVVLEDPPEELEQKFVNYYVDKRSKTGEVANKIITARYMTHLLGLAQNHGRWFGRGVLNEEDMEYAFERMMKHMTIAATDPKTGEVDVGSINGNMSEARMKEIELEEVSEKGRDYQWEWACYKAMALHEDGYFNREELVLFLKMVPKAGWEFRSADINKRIEHGITNGSVLTNNNGRFKWKPVSGLYR